MKENTSNTFRRQTSLPQNISELMATLRGRIRRYGVTSGLLLLMIAACCTFWLTTGIDSGWFALQRLELPGGFRFILFAAMVCGAIWLIAGFVLRPLFRRTADTEIALLVERQFPAFQDGLVTAVECRNGYPESGRFVSGMLQRTVQSANALAASVNVDRIFNLSDLKLRGWLAGILSLTLVANALARPGSIARWWDAFVLQKDVYHLRTTDLEFYAISQPGDRRRLIDVHEAEAVYLHPRGSDFEMEMRVPETMSPTNQPWIVPERVRVDVIRADGSRSRTYVSSTSDRTFRFILTRLQEDVEIEALAGDFRTTTPLTIRTVAPPGIDSVQADCRFPEYTHWNETRQPVVPVLGSEVSLPIGTEFVLQAVSSKPLAAVDILADNFEIVGSRTECRIRSRTEADDHLNIDNPLISADGRTIQIRFRLTTAEAGSATSPETDTTTNNPVQPHSSTIVPLPSNSLLRFVLHDEDDVRMTMPESLRILGTADTPPVISVRAVGVSNAVTRRAVIPVAGKIVDDYGVGTAGFQFIVDDESQWRPRPFRTASANGSLEVSLGNTQGDQPEVFHVQPLDLSEGQTLALAVVASDECTVPATNTTRSEPLVFRIVSNEELLSLLYTREIGLRQRFESVISQLEQIRDDLTFHIEVADRLQAAADAASSEDRISLTTCATRSGDNLRRQTNELNSITEGFEEIIQQLINNAIPPQKLAEDMQSDIVQPLRDHVLKLIPKADRSLSSFRVSSTTGNATPEQVKASIQDISDLIAELQNVLEKVRDMAELHEALSDLKSIFEEQLRILEETKALSKKRAIEKLKLLN
ncbi:MAG: hypothetical protein KDA81_00260 [Planctomycetaceae bacterium]|nr:hypothetical protein [Planctomycetaceae bacterium]